MHSDDGGFPGASILTAAARCTLLLAACALGSWGLRGPPAIQGQEAGAHTERGPFRSTLEFEIRDAPVFRPPANAAGPFVHVLEEAERMTIFNAEHVLQAGVCFSIYNAGPAAVAIQDRSHKEKLRVSEHQSGTYCQDANVADGTEIQVLGDDSSGVLARFAYTVQIVSR